MREARVFGNAEVSKELFKGTLFLKIAEGGAMGMPGNITVIRSDGAFLMGNSLYGDVDLEKVERAFPVLSRCSFGVFGMGSTVPRGWRYVNLGAGNHLIVRSSVYGRFMEILGDYKAPSYAYAHWIEAALSLLEERAAENNE